MNLFCLIFGCKERITKCNKDIVEFTYERCLKKNVNYVLKNGN